MDKHIKLEVNHDNKKHFFLDNTPIIFEKKSKKILVKSLTHINNDTGKTKHYTPAAQEWYNSIYSYNTNYTKTLPVADTNLMKLLRSYFSLEILHKIWNRRRNIWYVKGTANNYKRLSLKRLFLSRGYLKHTSSKAIITLFIYNPNLYIYKANKETKYALFYDKTKLKKFIHKTEDQKEIITYNRSFRLDEFLNLPLHTKMYIYGMEPFIDMKNLYLNNLELQRNILTKMVSMDLITKEDEIKTLIDIYETIKVLNYFHIDYSSYINLITIYYLKNLKRYKKLIKKDKMKFHSLFMSNLISLVKNIYNKQVEFNIIHLKKMHYNSDIYTQAVALKLKNRNNSLYRVLKSSLSKVRLPFIDRRAEKSKNINREELMINRIRNDNVTSMFVYNNLNDPLNNLLLNFFPYADHLKLKVLRRKCIKEYSVPVERYVLSSLKHLEMRGIRVEARGRISKRFTAARSVFKMRLKGGLKNVDSSFRGLPAIILRGHVKSNIQYSFISSKNRNGAFGVKGWVSSK